MTEDNIVEQEFSELKARLLQDARETPLDYLSGFMAAHMTDNDRQNKASHEALKYAKEFKE